MSHRSLASDNHSGVHPQILKSIEKVNQDHSHSYGGDTYSQSLKLKIQEVFGENFDPYLVFNGTAANTLGLNHFVRSWHSILCSDQAHLHLDECAAPEKIIGCKIIPIKSHLAKLQTKDIQSQITRLGDQHYSQVKAVSITQPTELGTIYSLEEIQEISKFCKTNNLFLHIDGARLANAVVALETSFKEICQYADVVSLGGTKNGLLFGEMVLLNKNSTKRHREFKFERKQALQLTSKSRFLSQQFLTYFENGLWKEIAKHSLNMAQKLKTQLSDLGLQAKYPVNSNAVFCEIPKTWIKPLREKIFFYVWEEATPEEPQRIVRLMTSFDTRQQDLDDLCQAIKHLQNKQKS